MPTPSTRTPVRIARGSYSNLNSSISDLQDGEISYAEDQNKLYVKEGSSLVALTYTPASPAFTGTITGVNLTLSGNLTVNGTQTIINTQTLEVEDKQIEIGKVSSPSDTTANGGGIVLKGSSDKSITWLDATDAWTSSEHIEIASGKNLKVDGTTLFVDGTNNRVGIGTTSPTQLLTLKGLSKFEATNSTNGWVGYTYTDNTFRLNYNGSGNDEITIDSSGNATFAGNITGVAGTFFKSSGQAQVNIGSGNAGGALLALDGDSNGDVSGGDYAFLQHDTSGDLVIAANNPNHDSDIKFYTADAATLALTLSSYNATFAGTVSDSKGNLRSIPQNMQGSAYTLVAADAGKHIITGSGVTIPNNVFAVGDAVTIISNSGSDQTITQASGLTIYNTADGSTGNRTLATRGMCTLIFTQGGSSSYAYISGAGLS